MGTPMSTSKQGQRLSVTALGPSGKRGAVSGESAQSAAPGQLQRQSKAPETRALILTAIADPRHLIFQGMSDEARSLVAECMFAQPARAGQDIIRQGEPGDIVYVIESGVYEVGAHALHPLVASP